MEAPEYLDLDEIDFSDDSYSVTSLKSIPELSRRSDEEPRRRRRRRRRSSRRRSRRRAEELHVAPQRASEPGQQQLTDSGIL
uniref:Uncharacterized protein n=1 Tax=Cyclopterus lumpus TaxID=8103 RepID=A0A8C2XPL3_CYCLU